MPILPTALDALKRARATTPGLLTFFPLGLIPGVLLSSAILFFGPTPEKGLYGGERMGPEELPWYITIVVTTLFVTWGLAVYQAKEKTLWPRWTSFLFGLCYGFLAGAIGTFLTLAVLVVLLFFVLFLLETAISHPLAFSVFSLTMIFLVRKGSTRTRKEEV